MTKFSPVWINLIIVKFSTSLWKFDKWQYRIACISSYFFQFLISFSFWDIYCQKTSQSSQAKFHVRKCPWKFVSIFSDFLKGFESYRFLCDFLDTIIRIYKTTKLWMDLFGIAGNFRKGCAMHIIKATLYVIAHT